MSGDHYIQQYTADQIPFYVHMKTGITSWTLPPHASPDAVKYITHLTEQGVPYYEDVENGTTSWTLPLEKLSTAARRNSIAIKKMDRRETDAFMAEEEKSRTTQMKASGGILHSSKGGISSIKEEDEESTSDKSGSIQGIVSRAPFSGPIQGGSESENNTDHSGTRTRVRSSSGGGITSGKEHTQNVDDKKNQAVSRFQNMAAFSQGEFSDDESESNTTATSVTTASSAGARTDHRKLRAQKRKEFQTNNVETETPVVRGKSPANTPAKNNQANVGTGGSNIIVQKANVRAVFEKYCEDPSQSGDDIITPQGLQELCLDYGTYMSLADIHITMNNHGSKKGIFQYEEFMVWWRNNPFSQMKGNNAECEKKFDAAAAYKIFDPRINGHITRQEFSKLHGDIRRKKLTSMSLDDCIGHLDAGLSGIIHFNDYIQLIMHPPAAGDMTNQAVQDKSTSSKKGGAMSKFFGAFGSKKSSTQDVAEPMVSAKDHMDYSKYFRLVDFGGNIIDVREQMRQAGLDDAMIHSPDKMIPAKSVKLKQEKAISVRKPSTFMMDTQQDDEDEEDFDDDESDGMVSHGSSTILSSLSEQQRQATENAFTNSFKKRASVTKVEASPPPVIEDDRSSDQDDFDDDESDGLNSRASSSINGLKHHWTSNVNESTHPTSTAVMALNETESEDTGVNESHDRPTIEVLIRKPLGLTLGENEPDEPLGVHVSKVVDGGNAYKNGLIKAGMVMLRACGQDVTEKDFDDVMDILRDAPKDEDLCLVFESVPEIEGVIQEEERNEGEQRYSSTKSDSSESEEDEEDEDEEEYEDDLADIVGDTGKNIWASHDLHHDGHDEEKQESRIEVDVERVEGNFSNEHSDEDVSDEEKVADNIDPLQRANSMFGGISDSDESDKDNEAKEEEAQTLYGPDDSQNGIKENVTENALKTLSESVENTTPQSSSFRARRLQAIQNAISKKPSNPTPSPSNEVSAPLENNAIIGRVKAPPRRSPSLPRVNTNSSHDDELEDTTNAPVPKPAVQQSTENSQQSSTGLPRRKKSVNLDNSRRRYERMLGSNDDDEWGSSNAPVEEPDNIDQVTQQPSSNTTTSPESDMGIPRRKRSIVVDSNERRYDRLFGDGAESVSGDENRTSSEKNVEDSEPEQEEKLNTRPELRIGTLQKSFSGHSLSGLSLSGVSLEKNMISEKDDATATLSPPDNVDGGNKVEEKQSQASTSRARRDGSSLTSKLKVLRSRRKLVGDNRETVEQKNEEHVESNENSNPAKRRSRSGKILNKQLNLLWKKDGKEYINRQKEEERAKAAAIISEQERVKPEEFRRRRQSFSATSPLELPDQESDEVHSVPSAIEEGSQSTASTTFAPSVIRKPISTFEVNNGDQCFNNGQFEELKKSTMSSLWGMGYDSTDDCSNNVARSHSSVGSDKEQSQDQVQHQDYDRRNSSQNEYSGDGGCAVETVDCGCQCDPALLVDEKHFNSYQMLLGEKQEVNDMQVKLHAEIKSSREQLRAEEFASRGKIETFERESLERVAKEESLLRSRMEQVEDIIQSEKKEIDKQWAELRAAEQEAFAVHAQKTQELLDLMHLVSAHHEKLQSDKKKIARQRLHLDMALQDINRFTKFSPDMSGKIGSVKYVNTRSPALGPTSTHKGFNSSASRLIPSPSASRSVSPRSRGALSPKRSPTKKGPRSSSDQNSIGRGLSRSQF